MPTCDEIASIADSVDRAARAHDLIWEGHKQPTRLRALRAQALRTALEEGADPAEIAARLGVQAADLDWMTRGDEVGWPQCA